MPDISESGSQPADNAADQAFDDAFNAAVESTAIDDEAYQPAADAPARQPVESDTTEDAASVDSEGGQPQASASLSAPAHWDAAKREAFGALTPDAQKIVTDLAKGFEADFTRKSTELANERRFAEGIRSLIGDQHRAQLQQAGMDEVQGIAHLLRLNDYATRDPVGYVRWVIGEVGASPQDVFPNLFAGDGDAAQGQQPAQRQPDPNHQLYQALNALRSDIDGIKHAETKRLTDSAGQVIESFRSAVDDGGNPKYPHFDRLEADITDLLLSPKYRSIADMSERLSRAYHTAVNADPTIHSEIVESEVERRLKERMARDDLAKAKRAQAPVSAKPTGQPRAKPATLDDALNRSFSDVLGA